jgi:hypothetical protein
MSNQQDDSLKPMPEQITYANLLLFGAWTGIFLLMITYFIYLGGFISPHVDISLVTSNWDKGVNEYLEITQSPQGWGWAALLHKGDFLNYIGLALLALLTIVCYFILMVGYKKQKDWAFFTISLLEILVLSLAASGIFGSGGH